MKSQKIKVGAFGLTLNKKGEFLVTLRNNPQRKNVHNKWQIPGGGVEYGETPQQALIREFQEELGVTPTLLSPYAITTANTWNIDQHGKHVILIVFIVDIKDQKISLNQESLDYQWLKPSAILKLDSLPKLAYIVKQASELVTQL